MGVLSNKIDKEQLKPGDHIYSWRQAYVYAHHALVGATGESMANHFKEYRLTFKQKCALNNPFYANLGAFYRIMDARAP